MTRNPQGLGGVATADARGLWVCLACGRQFHDDDLMQPDCTANGDPALRPFGWPHAIVTKPTFPDEATPNPAPRKAGGGSDE